MKLFNNFETVQLKVSEELPVIGDEPLFMNHKGEVWPMILQKALAKQAGSYEGLNCLTPSQLL